MEKEDDRSRRIAVVQFSRALPKKIYQRDLEEFLNLTEKLREAETRWDQKRDYLTRALTSGVRVEDGVREVFLSRLVVR